MGAQFHLQTHPELFFHQHRIASLCVIMGRMKYGAIITWKYSLLPYGHRLNFSWRQFFFISCDERKMCDKNGGKKGSHAVAITRIISTVWKCLIYAVMSVRLKRCCMQIIIHKVEWEREKRVSQIFPQLSSMIAVVFEFELRIDIFIALDDNEKVPSCAAWVRIIDPWKFNF
jgi:hypothetical protein